MNIEDLEPTRRKIINNVIGIEGGYVNDPADYGGETKFGITHATASRHGYGVKSLTVDQAFQIYEMDYWSPLRLDEVLNYSEAIAAELFDTGVNTGPENAAKFMQRALNSLNNGGQLFDDVKIDGDLGEKTLAAFHSYMKRRGRNGESTLFNILNSMQSMYYIELSERRPTDERFQHGWQSQRVEMMKNKPETHRYEDLGPAFDLQTGEPLNPADRTPDWTPPNDWAPPRQWSGTSDIHTDQREMPYRKTKPKRRPWYKRFLTSKINWTTMATIALSSGVLGNVDLTPEQQSAIIQTTTAVGGAGILLLRTFLNNPE